MDKCKYCNGEYHRIEDHCCFCEQLRAENAELRKDAERLNWLESNPRHAQIVVDGKITNCVFYGISCAELMKLRDAIDAAMKEQT